MRRVRIALAAALWVWFARTQTGCDQLNKLGVEVTHLFSCECVCECLEGYRGGGDGDINGGGVSFRCVGRNGAATCGEACEFQGLPGLAGGGSLLACFAL